jgi:hypothetical protein
VARAQAGAVPMVASALSNQGNAWSMHARDTLQKGHRGVGGRGRSRHCRATLCIPGG